MVSASGSEPGKACDGPAGRCAHQASARGSTEASRVGLGEQATLEGTLAEVRARDARDAGREAAPLRVAEGAVVIDTSDLGVEAAVDALSSLIEPLLIAVIGGCVGAAVVALYMPMFNIIKLIQ